MKKRMALLMALVMAASFGGCGNAAQDPAPAPSTQEPAAGTAQSTAEPSGEGAQAQAGGEWNFEGITLNVAHATTGEVGDAFLAEFEAFEALTGCKIDVEMLSADPDEQVSTLSVRAATGNLPDVWQNSIGAMLEKIDPKANVYDLSGQGWIKENLPETYLNIVTDSESGAVYGVPCTTSNVAGCFYNKSVYDELGLKIPTTWEEFMANCETIKTQIGRAHV